MPLWPCMKKNVLLLRAGSDCMLGAPVWQWWRHKGKTISTNPSMARLGLVSKGMFSRDNKDLDQYAHFLFSERDSYQLIFTLEETVRMLWTTKKKLCKSRVESGLVINWAYSCLGEGCLHSSIIACNLLYVNGTKSLSATSIFEVILGSEVILAPWLEWLINTFKLCVCMVRDGPGEGSR